VYEGQFTNQPCSLLVYKLYCRHCVTDKETNSTTGKTYEVPKTANQLDIIVGTNLVSSALPSNRYRVKRVIIHKDYSKLQGKDNSKFYNDVALLEIAGPIKFNKYVRALPIAPSGFNPQGKKKNEYRTCVSKMLQPDFTTNNIITRRVLPQILGTKL
jgi:hypothetical protein